jgi:hypothetical protein
MLKPNDKVLVKPTRHIRRVRLVLSEGGVVLDKPSMCDGAPLRYWHEDELKKL